MVLACTQAIYACCALGEGEKGLVHTVCTCTALSLRVMYESWSMTDFDMFKDEGCDCNAIIKVDEFLKYFQYHNNYYGMAFILHGYNQKVLFV